MGPVAAAGLAKVAGLGEVVVVVIAELGVGGVAARAGQVLLLRRWGPRGLGGFHRPPVLAVVLLLIPGVRRHLGLSNQTVELDF